MDGPRRARLPEYDELIEVLNTCFRPGTRDPEDTMLPQYYHIYGKKRDACHNNFVIRQDDKLASVVGLFPIRIKVEDAVLKVGGIGGVCSLPEFRKRGFMTAQLENIIRVMENEDYDLSILGGDRWRYGNYGWENGGRNYNFSISRHRILEGPDADVKIRKLEELKTAPRRIKAAHSRLRCHMVRSERYWRDVFKRTILQLWTAERKRRFAYAVTSRKGEDRGVYECAGDPGLVMHIIRHLLHCEGCRSVGVTQPAWRTSLTPVLLKHCSGWSMSTLGMLRIVSLEGVLRKYLGVIQRKATETSTRGSACIVRKSTGEELTLRVGKQTSLKCAPGRPRLELDDQELVRLLFGLHRPEDVVDISAAPFLSRIFPLPFWFNRTDSI